MSKKILLFIFLISGIAFSQTTVTLQDQCNCEVLSGTAVTAPGATAPTGADIGDIYVNTNTGTIYFWDGISWELTSSDNQQLQNFSFNGGTNQLTLVLENGGTLSVDLSSLNNIGTDDQTAAEVTYDGSASGLSAGTVQLAIDEISNATNTVNLIDNTDGTYTFTKADGTTVTISDTSVSTLINNGDATFTYTSEDGSSTLIDIRDFETLTAIALNADNTNIDYTDEDGIVTQLNLSAIVDNLETVTTIVANANGTFTYTDEDGVDTIIDITNLETLTTIALNADNTNIDYTDEDGVVTQLNLSAIVDNLETVTTIVANANGTFTYTDEDGVDTIIDITNLETLTTIALNADNTNIDYTDEDGVVTQLNLSAIVDNLETVTTIVANANGTFTYTDEDGVDTIIDITNLETLTTIALNADNTNIDYTDEDGVVTQLNLSAIVDNLETVTTIVANANGTFTYTDEDGVDTIIDITNLETLTTIALNADNTNIDYTDEDGVVTQLNLSAIVDNLETVTTIVANANGTFTYTDEDGVDTIIDITNLETLTTIALNADNTNIDYTDEDGVVTQLNLSAIVDNLETVTTIVANANGTFTYSDEDGVDTIIDITNLETLTTIALNADNTNIDYTDEDGVVTQLNLSAIVDNLETVTTIVANANGTFTYTDEDGVDTIIDITNLETLTTIALNADNTNIDYTDEDGVVTQLNLSAIVDNLETVTTIVANANGTFTYTDEDGIDTIIDITNLETLTTIALNADNTNIDYTDEDGVVTQLNLSAIVDNLETVTTIVANANGTFTYSDEDGVDTIIDITNLETLTTIALNADNTNIDYTDEDGVVTQLNLSAIVDNLETVTTIVANANGTFTYTDESGVDTIIDITNLETLTTVALNADNTNIDYTDEDGVVTQLNLSAIVDNLETVTTIVANANGTFTYSDEDGVDTIIDITNLETLTTIALNADNTNIDYTDEDGVVTQLNLSAIVDNLETVTTIVANANGTFTYTDESGIDTIIDITNLETLTTIALNADNTNIDYTDEDGVVTQLNLSAIVDNLETLTTIVANADGTFTYTDEDGAPTVIDITNLETLTTIALNADNTNIDYTDEDGVVTQLNLSALVDNLETLTTIVANADGTFTYTDEDGAPTVIDISNLETLTSIALNADNTNIDYTDEDGVVTQLNLSAIVDNLETVTTIVANANGTFTYTDESGVDTIIDIANLETLTSVALNADNANLDYTDEDGVVTQLDLSALVDNLETVTTMVANPGSTFTYTDESGIATIIDIKSLETLTTILNNGDGTITYTDELGVNQVITVLSTDANNDIIVGTDGGLYLNVASVTVAETVTNLVDNNNGTITYTNEDGSPQTISKSDITDNLDGTYTFTNNDGSDVIINTNGVTISNVIAGNRIATVTDAAGTVTDIDETITTLADNGNGTFTHTSENGTVTLFDAKRATVVDNANGTYTITDDSGTSVLINTNQTTSSLVDNGNGTYTYTDETGTPQIIDTRANSNPYTPTSGLTSTDVQGALDELAASNAADNDTDATNELQNIGEVLADGNDGGGLSIANIADPTNAQDAATKNYVDGAITASNQTVVSGDAGNLVTAGSDGGALLTSVDDADSDPTNEIQVANQVNIADAGANFTATEVEGALAELAASNAADNDTDATNEIQNLSNSVNVANESLNIEISGGTNTVIDIRDADSDPTNELARRGAGTPAATGTIGNNEGETYVDSTAGQLYVFNGATWEQVGGNASPDADPDPTNELQNIGEVLADGNDGGGLSIANIADPTNAQDAATKNYVDGAITASNQTVVSGDAGNLVTAGSDGGALLTSVDDADSDPTNEIQVANQVNIADTGANFTATEVEGALAELAASNAADNDTDATNELQNIGEVLADGNDAGGIVIDNIGTPIDGNDATTKDYVDGAITASNQTVVSGDAGNLVIEGTDGGALLTSVDDADADVTNELQNIGEVLADGNDGGGLSIANIADPTNAQDAATKNYVDGAITASNQTVVSGDGGNLIIEGTDGGALLTSVDDADADVTNELQNIGEVLADGNNAGGIVIDNIGTPIDGNDATTKDYVDAAITASNQTVVSGDAGNLVIEGTDGGALLTSVDDADADVTNELQNIGEVLADGNDGGGLSIANIADPTNAQDAATKNYVDGAITASNQTVVSGDAGNLVIEGTDGGALLTSVDDADADPTNELSDLNLAANILTLTNPTTGGNQVDLSSYVNTDTQDLSIDATGKTISLVDGGFVTINADDADADPTNEIQNLNQVLATGNDAGAQGITNLLDPVNPQDAATKNYVDSIADDDITGVSFNSGTNTITVDEGTTTFSADLTTLSETVVGANDIAVTDDGNGNYTVDYLDGDKDATNEYNTALGMNAGNLEVTDNGGTLSTGMISTDANNDIAFGADGKLYLNVSSVTISETITNLSDTGNGLITYENENGATQTVSKADITDNANGTYTFTNNDGSDVILDTRAISNPYNNIPSGLAATNVQEAIDQLAAGSTDNQMLSSSGAAGDISISNGNNISINVNDADADPTNELSDLNLAANILTLTNPTTGGNQVDLSSYVNTDTQDLSIDATGKTISLVDGGFVTINADDADADPTNEIQNLNQVLSTGNDAGAQGITNLLDPVNPQDAATKNYVDSIADDDITGVSFNSGTNTITVDEGTTTFSADLTTLSETVVGANDITVTDDGNGNYTVDYLDGDKDATNELSDLNLAANILTLTNPTTGGNQVDLSSYVNTDTQDLSIDATGKTISLVDGGFVTINADDADADPTNEIQNLNQVLSTGNDAGAQGIANLLDPVNPQDAATKNYVDSIADDDITGVSFNSGTNTITVDEGTTTFSADLTTLSETVVGANDITVTDDGNGNYTVDYLDGDKDATNELSDLNLAANILTLTNPTTGGNQVDLSSYVNTDTQDLSIDATGKTISLVDGGFVTINADDADADPTNEIQNLNQVLSTGNDAGAQGIANLLDPVNPQDAATKNYVDSIADDDITGVSFNSGTNTITVDEGTTTFSADLTTLSETVVGANDITVTDDGNGNYTVDYLDGDKDATNELSDLNLAANILTLTNPTTGGNQVDLSSYVNTDTQDLSIDATGKTISLVDGGFVTINADDADADPTNELSDLNLAANILTLTNPTTGGNQVDLSSYVNTDTQDLSIDATGKTISLVDGGFVTINADDADADPTNEIQNLNQVLSTGNDAGAQGITNLLDPVNPQDAATKNYVDSIADDDITGVSFNSGTNTITVDEGTTTFSADLTTLSETVVGANDITVTDDGNGNYTVDYLDGDKDATNELSDLNLAANILTLTNPTTGGNQVDLSSYVNTDTQDLSIDATGKTISLVDGGFVTINADDADADPTNEIQNLNQVLSTGNDAGAQGIANLLDPVNPQDAATKNYVDSIADDDITGVSFNSGTNTITVDEGTTTFSADLTTLSETVVGANDITVTDDGNGNYTVDYLDGDKDATNELSDLNLAANILTLTNPTTGGNQVDLSSYVNTDTQDLSIDATGKTISLVDGGFVTINADDADADPTNELSDLNLAANILTLTNPTTGGNQVDLSSYVNTDTQDLSIDATGKTISLVDGGFVTINADDADADPTNEIQNLNQVLSTGNDAGAQGITNLLDPVNPQDAATKNYVDSIADDDITGVSFNSGTNTITVDEGTTTFSADLTTLSETVVGANDITVTDDGNGNYTVDYLDGDKDATNELSDLNLAANILTLTNPTTGGNQVDLSSYVNTDTQDLSIDATGKTISLVDGGFVTINADDADADPTNELQTISRAGTDVTLSIGGGTVSINDADFVIGNEYNTNFAVSGTDLVITDGGGARAVPLATLGSDDQKIDKFVLTGTTLELSVESDGEADKTIDLNGTFATDAELAASDAADLDKVVGNEVTNATDATLVRSGTGTTASPYTLDVANGGITTTEILDGTIATIDLANNAVTSAKIADGTVVAADLANNAVTSAKILDGTIATADIASTGNNKVLVTSPAGIVEWIDKTALVPATTVSNTSTVNTLTTTVNSVTGAGVNIINSNALSLTGSDLSSTVNGVASAPLNLSSFLDNTDDQTAAEVNVVTPVDVDGDGTTEGTVEEVIQDIAPIVSKAARIFYPPSIAVDASTNGTFTIDLYAQYIAQYGSPTVGSAGAPAALPTYTAAELYYYVTYADPTVFNTGTMSIAADGKLTYTIIGQPSDYNSLINVVFVVK